MRLAFTRRLEEVGVVHAGDLDRVLERHEHAFARALVRIHVEQILAVVGHLAAGDLVLGMPGRRPRQRALAGPVRAHDGVDFAGVDVQVDPLEDLLAFGANLQILDIKHAYPTDDPSSETLSSFCASTANSIGSSRKTSLQKPLTIMLTASSVVSPRWRQ